MRFVRLPKLTGRRIICAAKGHLWDSQRPAGPIHVRDICWRCESVRPPRRNAPWAK